MSPDACPESRALHVAEGCVGFLGLLAVTLACWEPVGRFLAWTVLLACGENPEWPCR